MTKKKKKNKTVRTLKIITVVLLVVFLGLTGVFIGYRFMNPVVLKATSYQVQIGDSFDALDNLSYVFLGSKGNVSVQAEDIDTSQPGSYDVTYTYDGKDYPFQVVVGDFQAPELVVKDYVTDKVEDVDSTAFIESVSDDSDYTVTMEPAQLAKGEGEQTVTITATDSYGNSVSEKVTLTRQADDQAPTISNFSDAIEVKMGQAFPPADLVIEDNLDNSPVLTISDTIDMETEGTYQVTYELSDRSGNKSSYTQTVNVKEPRTVYLTFDDGPSANTLEILDILDHYGVKATFFVTAQDPEYLPYLKDIAEAGHTVAIHTYSHDYGSIYSSPENYFADLNAMNDLIEQYTGKRADVLRFPGGSSNTISMDYNLGIMSYLVDAVHEAGYQYFDWNVDSQDASGFDIDPSVIVAGATSGVGEPYANVLMHDTLAKSTTVTALPQIIEAYLAAGYDFEPLTKDSYPVQHGVNN